ncbi:hypothetical protein KY290_000407 [Solanum tuberosum]|uniref:Uncharacterized protein n=1 Tax=Solanum tuberosum TaxID=4113 RepID=A0ABQ7WLA1_SOLTU|nr:hypothetical protein KY284_000451 [Solanum tuberosum]KAH0729245.1 hypothetical protein KY289_000433 [Solanum tuberosum]KAH0780809.1 hypothetical protein KY290_000407 [Solanum tuberosum]
MALSQPISVTHHRQGLSMVKIRVEVDLLKSLPQSVWVGLEDDKSPLKGYVQKLEYEGGSERINAVPKIGQHGFSQSPAINLLRQLRQKRNNQIQKNWIPMWKWLKKKTILVMRWGKAHKRVENTNEEEVGDSKTDSENDNHQIVYIRAERKNPKRRIKL